MMEYSSSDSSVTSDPSEKTPNKKNVTNKERQQKYRSKRKNELNSTYGLKLTKKPCNKKSQTLEINTCLNKNLDTFSEETENIPKYDLTEFNLFDKSFVANQFDSISTSEDEFYEISSDSCSDTDSIKQKDLDDAPIFFGSKIKKKHFMILFESTVDKISIAESSRDILYKFIQLILPIDNNIPSSYYTLRKSVYSADLNFSMICSSCKGEVKIILDENKKSVKKCINETCHLDRQKLRSNQVIKIFYNRLSFQLSVILDNHYEKMVSYQKHLKSIKESCYIDVTSGLSYEYDPNLISLILFADGVQYNKSGANSIWVLLSSIAELPPLLRNSFENIVFHSLWTGAAPDFNLWLNIEKEIDSLINQGFEWKGRTIKLRILAFIADSPARAKACNTVQFNGYHGCIKCLHPAEYCNRVIIYPNIPKVELRSNTKYLEQVEKALTDNVYYEGVKGYSHLSNWIKIPDDVIFDYMHMCLLGTFKRMFLSFFDSSNWREPFYLNKVAHFVNNRLIGVRLPLEIKRKTKDLEERSHYKANEFRTIAFYLTFGLFRGLMNDTYLSNLMKYIIFLRLLCQPKIIDEEIKDSEKLIIDFMIEFQDLYGKMAMSSNIHGHLHLPRQVKLFGPLNKCSCFPFENVFKMTRNLFHGTRNFEGQIALNIDKRKFIRQSVKDLAKKNENCDIKFFINKNLFEKKFNREETCLIDSFKTCFSKLSEFERELILNYSFIISYNESVLCSNRACIKGVLFHTYGYDIKFDSTDSHSIEYRANNGLTKLGKIMKFFEIKGSIVCIVKNYIQKSKDHFFTKLTPECAKYIDRFFQIVSLSEDFVLIDASKIERRCISISNESEFVISMVDDLEEMD
ncbi:unnamed protein product [Brachionus calyciflorus]|uniref:Transposase domain-containing protein n=1 Tax=Brachionus calyciflorus TaxID=104777 RepID=A0A814K0K7_9BILA|nr:unnamed protein product [Brachionus calyciflorus]